MNTKEHLEKTKEILELYGWQKGSYGPMYGYSTGPHCLVGAIQVVANSSQSQHFCFKALRVVLSKKGYYSGLLTAWNDQQRSINSVLRVLQEAIDSIAV